MVATHSRSGFLADWTRGEVIRRLSSGQTSFGLSRFAPELGKASRMLN